MSLTPAKPKKSARTRPPLPTNSANPLIKTVDKEPAVKYQVIEREGQEIVIGRVKVPTPGGGHAFILRRFDTGAVSLTTMFRAAYPDATEDEEKADTAWIKAAFDISGANGAFRPGSNRQHLRLAGTWLPTDVALATAESYGLGLMVRPLTAAEPDMAQNFRKSSLHSNSANGADEGSDTVPSLPQSQPTKATSPPAAKRRKASPALPISPPPAIATTRKLRSSKSPAPQPIKPPSKTSSRKGTKASARAITPPVSSDIEDDSPYIGPVDADVDIAESKKLVEEMKSAYGTPKKPASSRSRGGGGTLKRVVEETQEIMPTTFEPKEPEIGERQIIPAPRRFMANLPPQRQAVAWGALAFALGLGATAFLPQIL